MSSRDPIVSLVDYNSGISWVVYPEQVTYWMKRLGSKDKLLRKMKAELDKALCAFGEKDGV